MNRYIDLLDEYNNLDDDKKITRDVMMRVFNVAENPPSEVFDRLIKIIVGEMLNLATGYVMFKRGEYIDIPKGEKHEKCNIYNLFTNKYHLFTSSVELNYISDKIPCGKSYASSFNKSYHELCKYVDTNRDGYQVANIYQQILVEEKSCSETLLINYATACFNNRKVIQIFADHCSSNDHNDITNEFKLLIDLYGCLSLPKELFNIHKSFKFEYVKKIAHMKSSLRYIKYSKSRGIADEILKQTCVKNTHTKEITNANWIISTPIHWILWEHVNPRKVLIVEKTFITLDLEKLPYYVEDWDDTYRCAFTDAVIYDDCYVVDIYRKTVYNSPNNRVDYATPVHLLLSPVAFNCWRNWANLLDFTKKGIKYNYVLYRTKCPVRLNTITANLGKYINKESTYVQDLVYEEILQKLPLSEVSIDSAGIKNNYVHLFDGWRETQNIIDLPADAYAHNKILGLVNIVS